MPVAGWTVTLMAALAPLAFQPEASVPGPQVPLGAVADLSVLPLALRERAATLPVAEVSPGRTRVVSARRLAELARARLPALTPWLPDGADGLVILHAAGPAAAPASPPACLLILRRLDAGAVATVDDAVAAPCGVAAPQVAFGYDRRLRAEYALRALDAGDRVRAPARALPAVAPGQRLIVSAQSGPVVVRREVEALQAASPGGRLFVRAQTGEVFAAELPAAQP